MATNLATNNFGWFGPLVKRLVNLWAIDVQQGAQTVIYPASSPDVADITGKYFVKNKVVDSSPASNDEAAASRLWEMSQELTGLAS